MRKQRGKSDLQLKREARGVMGDQGQDSYYSDRYGFIVTPESERNIMEAESKAGEERSAYQTKIEKAQAALNAAVQKNKQDVDKLWSGFEKDFVELRVLNPTGDANDPGAGFDVEKVYRLPKEVIENLKGTVWKSQDPFNPGVSRGTRFYFDEETGAYNIEPVKQYAGDADNYSWGTLTAHRRRLLDSTVTDLKDAYYEKIRPEVELSNAKLEKERKKQQDYIDSAQAKLDASAQADKDLLNRYKEDYESQQKAARQTALSLKR